MGCGRDTGGRAARRLAPCTVEEVEAAFRALVESAPADRTLQLPETALSNESRALAVKRAAARLGRLFGRTGPEAEAKRERAYRMLRAALGACTDDELRYWRAVVLIDDRVNGATGEGAYWAVASRVVNEEARCSLRERADGKEAA